MLFSIYIPLYENFIKTAHGLFELLSNLHLNSPAIRLALYFSEAVRSGFYRPIYEALRRYFTSEGYGTHKACFGQQIFNYLATTSWISGLNHRDLCAQILKCKHC